MNKKEKKIWILIISSSLSTLSLFISFPVVNIYLLEQFKLSPTSIGVISGIMPITTLFASFFVGSFAEIRGYLKSIKLGIGINIIAFFIMSISTSIWQLSFALFLIGIGKVCFDNATRASIIRLSKEDEIEKFFRLRYLYQNLGSVVGPLLSVVLYKYLYGKIFSVTSSLLIICLILISFTLNSNELNSTKSKKKKINLCEDILVLKDPNLRVWILSGLLIIVSYGAYEELMPVIIAQSTSSRPEFGILVSLNSIVVVISQIFIVKLLQKQKLKVTTNLGFALLSIGFLVFSIKINTYLTTIISVIIFSVGESILFPCFDSVMGKISPDDKRAVYYGIGEIKQIGFFIGPVIGGVILDNSSENIFFIMCSITIVLSKICFDKLYNNAQIEDEKTL